MVNGPAGSCWVWRRDSVLQVDAPAIELVHQFRGVLEFRQRRKLGSHVGPVELRGLAAGAMRLTMWSISVCAQAQASAASAASVAKPWPHRER